MKTFLRIAALAIALVTVALWFFGGMNCGWTKTSVPISKKDPVTEQDYVEWERHFLPGLDFLIPGLLVSAGALGASYCFRRKPSESTGREGGR